MLTPAEIKALGSKRYLTEDDIYQVLETLVMYLEVNETQARLLTQAIDEVVSLRARVQFYRNTTMKVV